jgi:uncharacterized membrane protein
MSKKLLSFPLALPFFVLLLLLPFFLLAIVALMNVSASVVSGSVLGVSPIVALAAYMLILVGSLVNIPVYEFKSDSVQSSQVIPYMGVRYTLPSWHGRRTVVALNLGGCVIPALISIYFALSLPLLQLLVCTVIVSLGVYYFSRPVRSVGVLVPVMVPPLLAVGVSFIAMYLGNIQAHELARVAFVAGVFGTIVGADILHIRSIRRLGAEMVSIGGAGTFDGILLTGILATIFAAIISAL